MNATSTTSTSNLSAAALNHIVEAQRKRWAEFRRKKAEAATLAKGPAVKGKTTPKKVAVRGPAKAAKKTVRKTAARKPKTTVAEAASE